MDLVKKSQEAYLALQDLRKEAMDVGVILILSTHISFMDTATRTGFVHSLSGVYYTVVAQGWTKIDIKKDNIEELLGAVRVSLNRLPMVLSNVGKEPLLTCVVSLEAAKELRKLNNDITFTGLDEVPFNWNKPSLALSFEEDIQELVFPWTGETTEQMKAAFESTFPTTGIFTPS